MSDIWFTADTHFGHRNIISHCNRPFQSVEEMDETLIKNWNSVVGVKDTVYVVGDFSLDARKVNYYLGRLNGSQKFLVMGNHDDVKKEHTWSYVFDVKGIRIEKDYIWLAHYGHRVWNKSHHGSYHFYGHSHGTLTPYGKSCDVGVDCWNYTPVNFERLKTYLEYSIDPKII
jgi:calcineurin-like phosphoesterase family protein